MTSRVLDVQGLDVGWGGDVLVRGLTFHVERGEIVAIIGASGSGKSTVLRFLTGLEEPRTGSVDVFGRGPPSLDATRPSFGFMFQSGALFGSMTVSENIALPIEQWTRIPDDVVAAIVTARLHVVGLDGAGEKLPSELSGGMRKRAALARALALDPELLFLDEPSAGLDPITASEIDALIRTLNDTLGLTVVFVSHELESIYELADRCVLLGKEERRVLAVGPPRALRDSDDPRVRSFFRAPRARKPARGSAP